jgi:hypothetical protein
MDIHCSEPQLNLSAAKLYPPATAGGTDWETTALATSQRYALSSFG